MCLAGTYIVPFTPEAKIDEVPTTRSRLRQSFESTKNQVYKEAISIFWTEQSCNESFFEILWPSFFTLFKVAKWSRM